MKVTVVGIKDIEFTDSRTGKDISGVQLFVNYPMNHVEGMACAKIFLDRRTVNGLDKYPSVGSLLYVDYDMKGKIIGVESA